MVLFDQMRPEYADRFNMPNFRRLRAQGSNFNNASLGYMGSETVIAHNVLMSGQQPRHMGWVDEAYRDTGNLLGAGANQMWVTGELSYGQYGTLIKKEGYPKLADYLQKAQPGKKFITVGEKAYAVESAAAESAVDTSAADIAVRFGSRSANAPTDPCQIALNGRYRGPAGVNVPSYLQDPCGRFFVNSDGSNAYGTNLAFPSWIYPLDGDRFVPGHNPGHLGGDTWVADAAVEMMSREDWSGMFVTMGGIDKAGHMWGAQDDVQSAPGSIDEQTHLKWQAENADAQLGKLLAQLERQGILNDTLVVLTADHGAIAGTNYQGKRGAGSSTSDTNWYYGPDSKPSTYDNPSPALQPLLAGGNVQFSYQSTSIQAWLKDTSSTRVAESTASMTTIPGVIATYRRAGDRYVLTNTNPMSAQERSWWSAKAQGIVDAMAGPSAPDVVGLLKDNVSYGSYGDHGGAQRDVQRVPMVFWSASAQDLSVGDPFVLPDTMPTILKALGIPQTHVTDGKAWLIP
ncbi:MAG TPA: alkaline phosphatase family protein [Kineosporiaceae bacterium]|nr:alkaline phosphatase family protein [Kineosporiaceae bacterium]